MEINTPIKINNKNEIEFYYQIEQLGNEQSCDDRFLILDSNKQYFNDFCLHEEDRQEEIKGILNVLEQTDLKEMCYIYDYYLYNSIEELSQEEYQEDLTEKQILDFGYTNKFLVKGKTYYTFKSDSRVD